MFQPWKSILLQYQELVTILSTWWFQPISKTLVKVVHFPQDRGRNKTFEVSPPSKLFLNLNLCPSFPFPFPSFPHHLGGVVVSSYLPHPTSSRKSLYWVCEPHPMLIPNLSNSSDFQPCIHPMTPNVMLQRPRVANPQASPEKSHKKTTQNDSQRLRATCGGFRDMFSEQYPRKLQHTLKIAHPRQSPWPTMKGIIIGSQYAYFPENQYISNNKL